MRVNERFFDDYAIGEEKVSFGRTITESDIILHAGQTGDWFPHHVDAAWCATQPFKERMSHGTLIFSVAVGMTADEINPRSMSYGYDRLRFIRPVFIGDTITSTMTVTEKRPHPKRAHQGIVEKTSTVTNQRGETVMSFVHLLLVDRQDSDGQGHA